MRMYQLEIPTKIYFGRGIAFQALAEEKVFLNGNVLIVTTGRSLNRLGYVEKLKKELQNLPNVKSVAIYDKISANPQLQEITKAAEEGRKNRTDIVVGFGGGSAIDAAKAVAAVIGTGNSVETLFYQHIEPDERTLPVVAIPTTAGTGSELSKAAILSDYEKHKKGGVRGKNLYPKLAIVDSVFTETVPLHITMETGFDVLAHAIESYVSKVASPFTKILSEQVISTAGKALMELLKQPLCHPLSLHEQVMTLIMANHGVFDTIETKEVKKYQGDILSYMDLSYPEIGQKIEENRAIDEELVNKIMDAVKEYKG